MVWYFAVQGSNFTKLIKYTVCFALMSKGMKNMHTSCAFIACYCQNKKSFKKWLNKAQPLLCLDQKLSTIFFKIVIPQVQTNEKSIPTKQANFSCLIHLKKSFNILGMSVWNYWVIGASEKSSFISVLTPRASFIR